MTRGEAKNWFLDHMPVKAIMPNAYQAYQTALSTLRPITREQVEKVMKGCEYCKKHKIKLVRIEMDYNETQENSEQLNLTRIPKFCPICGAPMTDEDAQMVMEMLKYLYEIDK